MLRCGWTGPGYTLPPPRAPLVGTPLGRHTSALGSRDVLPGGADRKEQREPMFAAVQCVGFALGVGLWCGSAELGGEGLEGSRRNKVASGQCPLQCGGRVSEEMRDSWGPRAVPLGALGDPGRVS